MVISYSCSVLREHRNAILRFPLVKPAIWCRLTSLGITKAKPTRRGKRSCSVVKLRDLVQLNSSNTQQTLKFDNNFTLWTWVRPSRLPRGKSCLVVGTPSANDEAMLDHLITTLTTIEGQYPACGIFLCGDFNQLKTDRLKPREARHKIASPEHEIDFV